MKKNKFLFIDRDGTLINEPTDTFQVDHINKLILEPNVILALSKLIKIGFKLIMITNQDNLGTDKFPESNFYKPHNLMIKIFYSQNITFDEILICPHSLSENCECRKPKTALVDKWLKNNLIDKENSYVIGDRKTDILLARNMGINGLLYNRNKLNWKSICNKLINLNRHSYITRKTKETNISIKINLDKKSKESYINTGIHFFNHMLQQIAIHGNIYINVNVIGDLHIDDHHTVEDTAIILGKSINNSLNNKIGINRFGFVLPMDECLTKCVIDISGRPFLKYKVKYKYQKIGDLSTEMIEHFFRSLSHSMGCTIHLYAKGENDHHKAESLFKAFGRALQQAICITGNEIPSSKGIIF